MKRNTPDHWKITLFAKKLGICKAQAVGHMEMLFHLVAKQAIHGNIGKMPDDHIAEMCGWEGDAKVFIDALVESRWLDTCSHERLIVHDWHEHCDDATKKAVIRSEKPFFKPVTCDSENGGQRRTTADNGVLPSLAKPSLAKPSLAKPNQADDGGLKNENYGQPKPNLPTLQPSPEESCMAQEFWTLIPGIVKSSVPEFAAVFKAKLEWLEANGRGAEKAKIWAEIRNPKRDREVVNTTNKMFKFWPGCGLDTSQPDPAADIEARTLKRLKEQEAQELAKKRSA